MPTLTFGQELNFGNENEIVRLKSKGDKIQFRLAGNGYYEGVHFVKDEKGATNITYCPRIMQTGECELCKKFFEETKKAKLIEDEAKRNKALKAAKDSYGVSIKFYYPILDRGTGKAKILQTTLSVRKKIEALVVAGIDVLASEFEIGRTEQPGSDYYQLIRVDSSEVKKLTEEENKELERAREFDLEKILNRETKKSDLDLEDIKDIFEEK